MTTLPIESDADIILKKFNRWADNLLSIYYDMPRQSSNHRDKLEERIKMLECAKTNLERIVKEILNGQPT